MLSLLLDTRWISRTLLLVSWIGPVIRPLDKKLCGWYRKPDQNPVTLQSYINYPVVSSAQSEDQHFLFFIYFSKPCTWTQGHWNFKHKKNWVAFYVLSCTHSLLNLCTYFSTSASTASCFLNQGDTKIGEMRNFRQDAHKTSFFHKVYLDGFRAKTGRQL